MLPTPSTSHIPSSSGIYPPSEDSYLLLDTLSSAHETTFLYHHFHSSSSSPSLFLVEAGTGSGLILAFLTAHSKKIFGRTDVLALGVDVNRHACVAARETVMRACEEHQQADTSTLLLGTLQADLLSALRSHSVDILVFNPPYVPTDTVPSLSLSSPTDDAFEEESRLLELAYAGGADGMEVTRRFLAEVPRCLSARGVCYLLLCRRNRPEEVVKSVQGWEGKGEWSAEVVGDSGRKGGIEKLCVLRISRRVQHSD